MELINITKEIEVAGVKFVPIVELCKMQLERIFGKNIEPYFSVQEVLAEENETAFGLIGKYFDDRVGFTFNNEDNWKEFILSIGEGSSMMVNQLEMFDKLRAWGFLI